MNTPTRIALGFAVLLIIVVAGYNLLLTDGSSGGHRITVDDTSLADAAARTASADAGSAATPLSVTEATQTPASSGTSTTDNPSGLLLAQVRQYAGDHLGAPYDALATTPSNGADTTSPSAATPSDTRSSAAFVFGNDITNAVTSDAPITTESSDGGATPATDSLGGGADSAAATDTLTTPSTPPTVTFGSEPVVPEDTYDSGLIASAALPSQGRTDLAGSSHVTPSTPTDSSSRPSGSLFDRIDTSRFASATPSTPAATTIVTTASPTEVPATYTIKPGDSFSSIAEKYYGKERYWVEIEAANPGVDSTKLRIGQTIKLPPKDAVVAAERDTTARSAASATDTKKPADNTTSGAGASPSSSEKTHTVQPGDTLSSIAKQHYGSAIKWRAIFKANQKALGNNPNHLRAGDVLVIPTLTDDDK